jgi:hypothetical protein
MLCASDGLSFGTPLHAFDFVRMQPGQCEVGESPNPAAATIFLGLRVSCAQWGTNDHNEHWGGVGSENYGTAKWDNTGYNEGYHPRDSSSADGESMEPAWTRMGPRGNRLPSPLLKNGWLASSLCRAGCQGSLAKEEAEDALPRQRTLAPRRL